MDNLRPLFERLRRQYSKPPFIQTDPLRYVYRFDNAADREVAALLSALFAYGRVQSIFGFLDGLLSNLGPSPADAVAEGKHRRPAGYRFQSAVDVAVLLEVLGHRIREHGFPLFDFPAGDSDAYAAIDTLIDTLVGSLPARRKTPGLNFLIGRAGTTPAKRLCLFYRWMVRPGFPDAGIYHAMTPARLIVPLDTHIMRIAQWTGLSTRRTPDRKTAREITERLRLLRPADPLMYDFALTRPGILGNKSELAELARGHR